MFFPNYRDYKNSEADHDGVCDGTNENGNDGGDDDDDDNNCELYSWSGNMSSVCPNFCVFP